MHQDAQSTRAIALFEPALFRWIDRWRWAFFALIAAMLIAGYNGRWRVGRDSSLYREVAHNLTIGKGYTFRGEREHHAYRRLPLYQGLPRMLAAIDRYVAPQDPLRPTVPLVLMALMAGATLLLIYHTITPHYPRWVAVCVVTGVGINPIFLQYAHELMTDMPFLLGSSLTLLGLSRWNVSRRWPWLVAAGMGLLLAAAMRPTCWALVGAIAGAGMIAALRSRYRNLLLITLAAVVCLAAVAWLGGAFNSHRALGAYEHRLMQRLSIFGNAYWWRTLDQTAEKHLPQAIFGIEFPRPLGIVFSALLVGGTLLLARKSLVWTLYVLATLAMVALFGSVTRYFLMVLPLLLLEWAIVVEWAARKTSTVDWAPAAAIFAGLGLATCVNVVLSCRLILEQHGIGTDFRRRAFLQVYRGGRMAPVVKAAAIVKDRVPPNQRVLGPEPRVMTYLSGRSVHHPYEVLARVKPAAWGKTLEKRKFHYIVWGRAGSRPVFQLQRLSIALLQRRHIRIERKSFIDAGGIYFARILSAEEVARLERIERAHAARLAAQAKSPATQPKP